MEMSKQNSTHLILRQFVQDDFAVRVGCDKEGAIWWVLDIGDAAVVVHRLLLCEFVSSQRIDVHLLVLTRHNTTHRQSNLNTYTISITSTLISWV